MKGNFQLRTLKICFPPLQSRQRSRRPRGADFGTGCQCGRCGKYFQSMTNLHLLEGDNHQHILLKKKKKKGKARVLRVFAYDIEHQIIF